MRITPKQLSIFIMTARYENITKAAQALFLSQSAASMALAELETQLGMAVFDRIGKKLILNANGEKLLPKAVAIIERIKEIETLDHETPKSLAGNLYIGASSTIGNYVLPKIICRFKRRHPAVKITLMVGNTNQIVNELLKFTIDIGFIEDTCDYSNIKTSIWGKDQLLLFASPYHRLAKKKKITFRDLQQANWVLRESGSGTRRVVEKAMSLYLKANHIILELGSTEAVKEAVKDGIGISCLSRFAIKQELQTKELFALPLPDLHIKRNFYRIMHPDKYQTALLETFLRETDNKML